MPPRYSIDHTKTPTRADIEFIANHPDCVERLQQFLRINDLESVEDPSPDFYLDLARLLLAYNSEGTLKLADEVEREVSARWSPTRETHAGFELLTSASTDDDSAQLFGSRLDCSVASCSSQANRTSVMQPRCRRQPHTSSLPSYTASDYSVVPCSTLGIPSRSQVSPSLQNSFNEQASAALFSYPAGGEFIDLSGSAQHTRAQAQCTPPVQTSQALTYSSPEDSQPSPRKPSAFSLVERWAARFGCCTLPLDPQPPRLSATRELLRSRIGLNTVRRFCTIMREPLPLGVCPNIMFLDAKSTPIPIGHQPGAPVFVISHIGPIGQTGWAPVVQVMSRAYTEDKCTYMGRYTFKWRAASDARLPADDWAVLPKEMRRHILRNIQYARDEHAKKITARAYLRAKNKVVDPPTVRALVKGDKRHQDRFNRSPEGPGMREIEKALNAGTERLYLYSLQCDTYDEAFASALSGLLG